MYLGAEPLGWFAIAGFGALRALGPPCGRTNENKIQATGRMAVHASHQRQDTMQVQARAQACAVGAVFGWGASSK
jgi:hypothetical protein